MEIIDRLRRPDDLPFFARALQDPIESVWQAAIEGLVSQPSGEYLKILTKQLERERALVNPNKRRVLFIKEAVSELQKASPFGIVRRTDERA